MRQVTPVLEYSEDPLSDTTPTYQDISSDLIDATWGDGKQKDLDDPQAGFATFRLKNTNRRHEPEYQAGEFYPNIRPMRRYRLTVETEERQGIEFWGDFEVGADGTAPEWTAGGGAIECKAGAEARQIQYVSSPTPRLGTRILRAEVASGDQFGASTGERAMLRRGNGNDAFVTSDAEGVTAYYQWSFRCLAPWTHPSGWEIFQQFKGDTRFGQPMMRLQVNDARTHFRFSVDSGEFPTLTDANNGTNAGLNVDFELLPFAADQWFDVRYKVRWSSVADGSIEVWMKPGNETTWLNAYRFVQMAGVQTIATVKGDATLSNVAEYVGFYRNAQAHTNVVFQDGYQVGHSWTDVDYPTTAPFDPAWNKQTWDGRPNILDTQGGSPGGSYENSTSGAVATGGGITVTSDNTRSKFGSYSLKVVTDGSGSSQGVRHFKTSGNRFDVTAGSTYTCSCWYSGDGFQTVRLEIEYFDSGAVSLGTTQALSRALRTDFRRHWLTTVAPVGAVTARIGTRWSGTTAGTFYVDGVGLWEGTYGDVYDEGIWYSTSYEVVYPDKSSNYSEVIVNCVDGMGLLSLDTLDLMDPPDAQSYEDVVNFDQPSFYYRLGEPEGTKATAVIRRRRAAKGETGGVAGVYLMRYRAGQRRETRAEVEGVSGPPGSYKNTPLPGEPGAILGDSDTCVRFRSSQSEHVKIPMEQDDLIDTNKLTVECWAKWSTVTGIQTLVAGPNKDLVNNVFRFFTDDSSAAAGTTDLWGWIENTDGGAVSVSTTNDPIVADTWYYLALTWNGAELKLWVNAVNVATTSSPCTLRAGTAGNPMWLARSDTGSYFNGWLDEVSIYEKALEPGTVLRHYQAGAQRGFAQQAAGSRVSSVVAHDLWSESGIPTGTFQIVPRFEHGQSKLDEVSETVRAEGPDNLFYFDGRGDPVYLPWNYKDGLAVSTTLGDAGGSEIPYRDVAPRYDDEIFNEVTTSTGSGVAQTSSDATSSGEFRPRRVAETGLILVDDDDAKAVGAAILDEFKEPLYRFEQVSIPGRSAEARTAILGRTIGDLVRVKRRQGGGTAIDVVTTILGQTKTADRDGNLWCTWNLARGFNASLSEWHLGVSGFSELGSTAVLA